MCIKFVKTPWDLPNLYTAGEVTLAAIPEPTSLATLLFGVLLLLALQRTLVS
jgi:hypothetical protein